MFFRASQGPTPCAPFFATRPISRTATQQELRRAGLGLFEELAKFGVDGLEYLMADSFEENLLFADDGGLRLADLQTYEQDLEQRTSFK